MGIPGYEISNYASDGRECRHNIGYWKRESTIWDLAWELLLFWKMYGFPTGLTWKGT